jgi:hypothetical protein
MEVEEKPPEVADPGALGIVVVLNPSDGSE